MDDLEAPSYAAIRQNSNNAQLYPALMPWWEE
jgi:hypothetical protein